MKNHHALLMVLTAARTECSRKKQARQTRPSSTATETSAETNLKVQREGCGETKQTPVQRMAGNSEASCKDSGGGLRYHFNWNSTDVRPVTVEIFCLWQKSGFYDRLTFHHIIDGFMIQGGDPLGTGAGRSDTTIRGGYQQRVDNPLSHTRGAISMARSQDKNSAKLPVLYRTSGQPHLDGDYMTCLAAA